MVNILYIDDFHQHQIEATASGLSISDIIRVDAEQPRDDWESQLNHLLSDEVQERYDGYILDLRLGDIQNSNNKFAHFKGSSVAQELRTLAKEGTVKEKPIFLLSANDQMNKSLEATSLDLFDLIIDKNSLNYKSYGSISYKILEVCESYRASDSASQLYEQFICPVISKVLDARLKAYLSRVLKTKFEYIKLIKQGVIDYGGSLICEATLGARLGIDKEKSTDYENLISAIANCKYSGLLSIHSPRWWADDINELLLRVIGGNPRMHDAAFRVEKVKEFFGLQNLLSLEKPEYSVSTKFWTSCVATMQPLDPIEGFRIISNESRLPWLEPLMISPKEALMRSKIDMWIELSPVDISRYNGFKQLYK